MCSAAVQLLRAIDALPAHWKLNRSTQNLLLQRMQLGVNRFWQTVNNSGVTDAERLNKAALICRWTVAYLDLFQATFKTPPNHSAHTTLGHVEQVVKRMNELATDMQHIVPEAAGDAAAGGAAARAELRHETGKVVHPALVLAEAQAQAQKMGLLGEGSVVHLNEAGLDGYTAGQALLEWNPALLVAATPLALYTIVSQTATMEAASHTRSLVEDGYLRVLLPAEFALWVCLQHATGADDPVADVESAVLTPLWPLQHDLDPAQTHQLSMFTDLQKMAELMQSNAQAMLSEVIRARITTTGIITAIHQEGAHAAVQELMLALSWMPLLKEWPEVSHCNKLLPCV